MLWQHKASNRHKYDTVSTFTTTLDFTGNSLGNMNKGFYTFSLFLDMSKVFDSRDVYSNQKSIRYVSSIHCFDIRYVSLILICSKYQDKQVRVLMTGPPEPHFDMCTTSQDSGLA